jgi:hypothetical protein
MNEHEREDPPETFWTDLTPTEQIERLRHTLGTLITWLERELGAAAASALLKALHEGVPPGDAAS